MKKGSFAIILVSLILISFISFASANIFSDFWNKITGKATTYEPDPGQGTCADSDSGVQKYIKGTVTVNGSLNYADFCATSTSLTEYSCPDGINLVDQSITCDYGCSDGACKSSYTSGGWLGCRGNGYSVCTDHPNVTDQYFVDNPSCTRNDNCQGLFYSCDEALCPKPITPPTNDITPPVRSNGSPSGILPTETTAVNLSLITNEAATCRYGTTPDVRYITTPLSTTGSTTHSVRISIFVGGNYYYYISCTDTVGNVNTDVYGINFTVPMSYRFYSCTDTDVLQNRFIKGNLTFKNVYNQTLSYWDDRCVQGITTPADNITNITSSTTLLQFYCLPTDIINSASYGLNYSECSCLNGACISANASSAPSFSAGAPDESEGGEGDIGEPIEGVTECDNGCLVSTTCYPLGYRKSGEYCSDNFEFVAQFEAGSLCENNFECGSNVCVSGQCVSQNLIQKIINWFRKLFGKE